MSVQKKKRISKKNKSAWRKTDIKDVEEFLDNQRQEERIGSFTEKKNEELFTVDVTPRVPKRAVLTEKQKRKLNAQRPLRSLEALRNTSQVQDPIVKRNKVKQKKAGRNIEEEVYNPKKPRHFQSNKDRIHYYENKEKKIKKKVRGPIAEKDVWAEEDFRDSIPGLKDDKGWISKDLALYTTKNIGKPVVKVHDGIRHRTTKAKNFEPPHAGMSYNPSLEDHQKLISEIVEREEKIIKEEKHLKRVTTQMFSKVTPEERDLIRLKEMRSGLDEEDESKVESKEDSEVKVENAVYKATNPPVANKKKSKQARNRELKQKELQRRTEQKKALKKQIADLNRVKSLKAEVLAEEEKLNELKKRRKQRNLQKKFEPKRLGRLKYVEPDTDVNMPEDIPGNLRNCKPESSLLVDRFKSFQKRNILPVSVARSRSKARKVKRYLRSSHKEPGVSFQMLRDQRKAARA